MADAEPQLREAGAEVMASWIDGGRRYLTGRGLSATDAREVMYALLTALEGGFLLARGMRSAELLLAAGRALAGYVSTLRVELADLPR